MENFFTNKKISLSRDYIVIIVFMTVITLIIISLYSWLSYKSYIRDENRLIISTSIKIEQSLAQSFNYANHLMDYFAKQINKLDAKDAEHITKLLRGELTSDPLVKKLFSWTLFDWIDMNNQLISSTSLGNTIHIDMSKRDYIKHVKFHPWKLHFSSLATGTPSGELIIPAAFGVTDNAGKYLGAIAMGFSVVGLKRKIEEDVGKESNNLDFIILDINSKQVLSSSSTNLSDTISLPIKQLATGELSELLEHNDILYTYYRKMTNSPFLILIGYNKIYHHQEISDLFFKKASGVGIIAAGLIIVLLIFRKMLVYPIVYLSKAAEVIIKTDGKEKVVIPESNIKELSILGLQLLKLINFIQQLKSTEQNLRKSQSSLKRANIKIKDMNNNLETIVKQRTCELEKALASKSEFLNNMSHEIRTPIQGFTNISEGLIPFPEFNFANNL